MNLQRAAICRKQMAVLYFFNFISYQNVKFFLPIGAIGGIMHNKV